MSKKYIPQQMISQSRFIDLYNEWNEEYRALLIDRMNTLIQENSKYTDSKNYGFLCNLLTSLAIVQVLESKGMPRKEAQQYTADAMYKFLEPKVKSMKKLASHGWFVPMLKLTMPLMFKKCIR